MELNKIYHGDCLEVMKELPENSVDLTVTSPPYDDLRTYNGYEFNFERIANELYRITKEGGVVVWVVGDATVNGSETGTSFKQALYFKELGFNLHDTMIYWRSGKFPESTRYWQDFEYMFVFSKSKINKFNPIKEKSVRKKGERVLSKQRERSGRLVESTCHKKETFFTGEKNKGNIWYIPAGWMTSSKDEIAYNHPAIFPEKLAQDHIISWSNPGDIVLDPMCGSGTTCKMALKLEREFIGIEISKEYVEIAQKRIDNELSQLKLF